jgi:hypothetical protein
MIPKVVADFRKKIMLKRKLQKPLDSARGPRKL